MKILRSMMFVPGHNEKLLESAARSNADALILDIEDSVVPDDKEAARNTIRNYVLDGVFGGFPVFPRVNDKESGHLLRDVSTLTIRGVAGFVYPKAKTGNDIYFFDKLLETIEYEKKLPIGTFEIVPLIETAAAVLNAQEICLASSRVIAIAYGCEDFIADLRGIHDHEGKSLYVPRATISMAARATGVIPIDTVHVDVHDLEDFEKEVRLAATLGFEGNLILHPKEIEIAHKYYTPSKEAVDAAREMLRLSEEARKLGKGVAVLDGKFIGPPMVITAKRTIERYNAIKQREAPWQYRESSY